MAISGEDINPRFKNKTNDDNRQYYRASSKGRNTIHHYGTEKENTNKLQNIDLYIKEIQYRRGSREWLAGWEGISELLHSHDPRVGEAFWSSYSKLDADTAKKIDQLLEHANAWRVWSVALIKGTKVQRKTALERICNCNGIGDGIALPLCECACRDPVVEIRIQAIETIARLYRQMRIDIDNPDLTVNFGNTLANCIRDPDAKVREATSSILWELPWKNKTSESLFEVLAQQVQVEENPAARSAAWNAMSQLANKWKFTIKNIAGFKDALRKAVWDKNSHIRETTRNLWLRAYGDPLPKPPGWWMIQALAIIMAVICVAVAVLAIWGLNRPGYIPEIDKDIEAIFSAAASGAWATGTIMAVGYFFLVIDLIRQSGRRAFSLPTGAVLLMMVVMIIGGLTLMAWGHNARSGRKHDCIILTLLTLGGVSFCGFLLATDVLVIINGDVSLRDPGILAKIILDGMISIWSVYTLIRLIGAWLKREKRAERSILQRL